MKQGQTLDLKLWRNQGNARDVAARVRPTLGDTGVDWVCTYWCGDNRDSASSLREQHEAPNQIVATMTSGFSPTSARASSGICVLLPDADIND